MIDPKQPADTDDQLDAAALAALGFLAPREAMAALRSTIVQMQETLALLVEGVPLVTPPPSVRERLLGRVAAFEQLRPIADVRRNEDTWVHSGLPGIDIKTLFTEPALGRSTYLVRMEPGAHLPSHRHGDIEQCLVIEGDIRWGDLAYEKGDFVVMDKGTEHPEIHTVHGNVLLLIAGRNEFQHAR